MTFEIEPLGDLVKLTVVHDGFAPGSVVLPDIPAVAARPGRPEDAPGNGGDRFRPAKPQAREQGRSPWNGGTGPGTPLALPPV